MAIRLSNCSGHSATLAVLTVVTVLTPSSTLCQGQCSNIGGGSTPSLTPLVETTASCVTAWHTGDVVADSSLPDGSFLLTGSVLEAGARAQCDGQCIQRGYQPFPNCVVLATTPRNIQFVSDRIDYPNGLYSAKQLYNVDGNGNTIYLQTLDTSETGGPTNLPLVVNTGTAQGAPGVYTIKQYVVTTSTPCLIQPYTHPEQTQQVNVASCRPAYLKVDTSNSPHYPDTSVTVSIPAGEQWDKMAAAAAMMENYWDGAFEVSVTRVPCDVNDGSCVAIGGGYTGPGCARFDPGARQFGDGRLITPSSAIFPDNWVDVPVAVLATSIAHELGHGAGLHEFLPPTCPIGGSIMGPAPACNVLPQAAQPTALDKQAAKNGLQVKSKRACGW